MNNCFICGKPLILTSDINGACSTCQITQPQILGRAIFKTPELKTWQCPFCRVVYNGYVPSCTCQNKIESEANNE